MAADGKLESRRAGFVVGCFLLSAGRRAREVIASRRLVVRTPTFLVMPSDARRTWYKFPS
jgi:hypothetical protein